jgi:hypothetical protein
VRAAATSSQPTSQAHPLSDRQSVIDYARHEFNGLHNGNVIRYPLTAADPEAIRCGGAGVAAMASSCALSTRSSSPAGRDSYPTHRFLGWQSLSDLAVRLHFGMEARWMRFHKRGCLTASELPDAAIQHSRKPKSAS